MEELRPSYRHCAVCKKKLTLRPGKSRWNMGKGNTNEQKRVCPDCFKENDFQEFMNLLSSNGLMIRPKKKS